MMMPKPKNIPFRILNAIKESMPIRMKKESKAE